VPEDFFELSLEDRRELFEGASARTPLNARILEKDVWVCWTLDALFGMPNAPRMAFKGGTALSKAYGVIERFSEDVDVTMDPDHELIAPGFDPLDPNWGKNKLKKLGERISRDALPNYVATLLKPSFEARAKELPEAIRPTIRYDPAQPIALYVEYPTCLANEANELPYVAESVLVELGVRATTEPSEPHTIRPYLHDFEELREQLVLPAPSVPTLIASRTYWEKATLMHYEITRVDGPRMNERYARHWYDLYRLDTHPAIGPAARADATVRDQVIRIKKVHFGGKQVDYDACRTGSIRLVPRGDFRKRLERDYAQMRTAGMFFDDEPPAFDEILEHVESLEEYLNRAATTKTRVEN